MTKGEKSRQKQRSKRLCTLYVRTRVLVFYTRYRVPWYQVPVHGYDRSAHGKNAASDTLDDEQRQRKGKKKHQTGRRASLILRGAVPGDHSSLSIIFMSVSSERAEVIYLLVATTMYRAAACCCCCCCCFCDGSRKRQGQRTKRAQTRRESATATSPALPPTIAQLGRTPISRRGPCRHAPSCTKAKRCCAAMSHKPACFSSAERLSADEGRVGTLRLARRSCDAARQ